MSPFRFLFPSFEKPVARQPYIKLERPRRRLSGVGIVLGVSVFFGLLFALPEILQVPKGQPQFDDVAPAKTTQAEPVTTATAPAETPPAYADASQPAVKLSVLCAAKPTVRRACVQAKAAKEAMLSGALARADAAPAAQPTAPKPKAKTVRALDAAPVYRRADGSLEVGSVAGGEYRPSRSAELAPPAGQGIFGLQ